MTQEARRNICLQENHTKRTFTIPVNAPVQDTPETCSLTIVRHGTEDLVDRPCIGALFGGDLVDSWTVADYARYARGTYLLPRAPPVEDLTEEPTGGVMWSGVIGGRNHVDFVILDAEAYSAQMRQLLGLD